MLGAFVYTYILRFTYTTETITWVIAFVFVFMSLKEVEDWLSAVWSPEAFEHWHLRGDTWW